MKVLSVSEFRQLINEMLAPLAVVVEGEISQIRVAQGKWGFLEIKDNEATVNVFAPIFKIVNFSALEEGMLVKVYGVPNLYKNGRFSLQAEEIVPSGAGALQAALQKLKKELAALGYFNEERKRPLPEIIRRVGLITAAHSRAYSDFIKVINGQRAGLKIDLYPVSVQGREAVASIRRAIDFFNRHFQGYDVLVIIRGGGSAEDLFVFNSRALVEAIYGARVPVIVGIGHEKDETLVDLVADVRAPTPTAAAQIINEVSQARIKEINNLMLRFSYYEQEKISRLKESLAVLGMNLRQSLAKINQSARLAIADYRHLVFLKSQQLASFQKEIEMLKSSLKSFDYHHVLKRGFTLTRDRYGKIIRSPKNQRKGEKIYTQFYQGQLISQIIKNN